MTVTAVSESPYTGNGAVSVYSIGFYFLVNTDIVIYETTSAGVQTTLTYGVNYTVTGAGNPAGGFATRTAGVLPTGSRWLIARNPAVTQPTDLRNQGDYYAEDVERIGDRGIMIAQAMSSVLQRTIRAPLGDLATGSLPAAALRANQFMAFDASGNPTVTASVAPSTIPVLSLALVVDTIAQLKALALPAVAQTYIVRGYYAAGDGGGGQFRWNSADVTADNGGTIIALAIGGVGRWNRETSTSLNPRWFGAKGDGANDDASAIMATYAALPATGGCLYFSPGTYKYNSQLDFSTRNIPLDVQGAGVLASRLVQNFSVGDGIKLNGASVTFSDFGFYPNVNCDRTAYMVNVNATNAYLVTIHDLFFNAALGNLISLDNISMLNMYAVNGVSNTGTNGDNCLRIKGVAAGTISNCYFRTGENGVTGPGSKPCLWLGGAAAVSLTSLKITGCGFQGGGPRYSVGTRGLSSTPADFSIIMDAKNTEFKIGGYVVLRGISPAAYNGAFRINNVDNSGTFTVINVLSTLNPGASTVNGTVETLSTCGYIENGLKSANESAITGCLFEALSWQGYGSAGLWLDGTQDTRYISGISLNGNYIDYGATSLVLQAFADAGTGVTVEGIDINGLQVSGSRRAIMNDGAVGVTISGLNGTFGITSDNTNADTLTNIALGSIGIAVLKGPANKCRGTVITGCNVGSSRTWDDNAQATGAMSTGIAIDDTVDSLTIVGNNIYGYVTPMAINVSTSAAGMLWNIGNNQFNSGIPFTAAKKIPTVASAASITLPIGYDTVKVSGVTTVTAMLGGYVGRVVNVISTGAITYGPGAGFARAAGVVTVAGQVTRFVWDGTQWAD